VCFSLRRPPSTWASVGEDFPTSLAANALVFLCSLAAHPLVFCQLVSRARASQFSLAAIQPVSCWLSWIRQRDFGASGHPRLDVAESLLPACRPLNQSAARPTCPLSASLRPHLSFLGSCTEVPSRHIAQLLTFLCFRFRCDVRACGPLLVRPPSYGRESSLQCCCNCARFEHEWDLWEYKACAQCKARLDAVKRNVAVRAESNNVDFFHGVGVYCKASKCFSRNIPQSKCIRVKDIYMYIFLHTSRNMSQSRNIFRSFQQFEVLFFAFHPGCGLCAKGRGPATSLFNRVLV